MHYVLLSQNAHGAIGTHVLENKLSDTLRGDFRRLFLFTCWLFYSVSSPTNVMDLKVLVSALEYLQAAVPSSFGVCCPAGVVTSPQTVHFTSVEQSPSSSTGLCPRALPSVAPQTEQVFAVVKSAAFQSCVIVLSSPHSLQVASQALSYVCSHFFLQAVNKMQNAKSKMQIDNILFLDFLLLTIC